MEIARSTQPQHINSPSSSKSPIQSQNQVKKPSIHNSSFPLSLTYIYPIAAGFFGFAATAIGSHFFRLSHPYYYIILGILLFLVSNHLLYKLKFNSYYSNGSTVTTTLVFTSQVVSMALYKMEGIGWRWIVGVILILIGTVLIEPKNKISQKKQVQNNQSDISIKNQ